MGSVVKDVLTAYKIYSEVRGVLDELKDIVCEKLGEIVAELYVRIVKLTKFQPTIGKLYITASEITDGFAEAIKIADYKYRVFEKACEKLGVEDVKIEVKKDDKSGVSETTR